jgi:hypothetical protein
MLTSKDKKILLNIPILQLVLSNISLVISERTSITTPQACTFHLMVYSPFCGADIRLVIRNHKGQEKMGTSGSRL